MRGEKLSNLGSGLRNNGSSPLARGKARLLYALENAHGIIPACAGKSLNVKISCSAEKDHPRLRGEKPATKEYEDRVKGSSPLARGKVFLYLLQQIARRIIPACAGKSQSILKKFSRIKDHPRLRGEKYLFFNFGYDFFGSSPLARGKGSQGPGFPHPSGIIPACAGKSGVRSKRGRP